MITPDALMVLAKSLLSSTDEARNRAAVGRAYYAAFHAARNKAVRKLGYTENKGRSAHQHLIKHLITHPKSEAKLIGSLLRSLIRKRNIADYELKRHINKNDAALDVIMAAKVIERVKGLK